MSARAGIVTPLNSDRLVYAQNRETNPQRMEQLFGSPFGPWLASVTANNSAFSDPGFNINGSIVDVAASQQATFVASGVSFSGFVDIDHSFVFAPHFGVTGISRSFTTFHVSDACPYQLDSTFLFTGTNPSLTTGSISLVSGTSGPAVFTLNASGSRSGLLAAGDYTLKILIFGEASGISQGGDSRRQIDATFTIPTPVAAMPLAACALALRRRPR